MTKLRKLLETDLKKLILNQDVKGVVNRQPTDYAKHVHFLKNLESDVMTFTLILNDLELSSQTIVPKQNEELVIEESEIHDDDEIRLIQIIYGG